MQHLRSLVYFYWFPNTAIIFYCSPPFPMHILCFLNAFNNFQFKTHVFSQFSIGFHAQHVFQCVFYMFLRNACVFLMHSIGPNAKHVLSFRFQMFKNKCFHSVFHLFQRKRNVFLSFSIIVFSICSHAKLAFSIYCP